jgi:hypothetical protein
MERFTAPAVVVSNTLAFVGKNNTPSVKITVKFNHEGKEVILTGDLWLTYKTAQKTRETLEEAFGFTIQDDLRLLNEPILAGQKCSVVIDGEVWEGEERMKISFFNKDRTPKRLSPEQLAAFTSETNKVFTALGDSAGTAAAGPAVGKENEKGPLPF